MANFAVTTTNDSSRRKSRSMDFTKIIVNTETMLFMLRIKIFVRAERNYFNNIKVVTISNQC